MPGAQNLDRLSPEDVHILRLEAGPVSGHTCKVLILEPFENRDLPTLEELRDGIEARLDEAPRLRQRLVETPLRVARPVWVDDPVFDIARHITRVDTAGPVSHSEFEQIVGELMTHRLDRAHPLWHIDVVESLDDGSMALIWRIHHCMADGATCMHMCGCVLWSDDPAFSCEARDPWTPCEQPGILRLLAAGVADHARPKRGNGEPAKKLSRDERRATIERELSPTAAMTDLGGHIGRGRRVAFAQAPLEDCRAAGKAIDSSVTLNDVALAIVAGGARQWLMHVHGPMDGIRVKVPVSLHHTGDDAANHDSCFFVDLPVGVTDPTDRVLAINRETTERKLDHDAETLYRLGTHPLITRHAMSPHVFTFNVSNVRGPAGDIYILGARVRAMFSLAEIAQHHALRVSVISAVGWLFFGFCADADAMKDIDILADGVRSSIDELLALRT